MPDARFFQAVRHISLKEVSKIAGAEIGRGADAEVTFEGVAPLQDAGPKQISFLDNKKYVAAFEQTKAGACLVSKSLADRAPDGVIPLICEHPYRSYAKVAQAFYPDTDPEPGVAQDATLAATAKLAPSCRVEAGAVVGEGVEIGENSWIGPNAVIGNYCVLGEGVRIGAHASLQYCLIGDRVILHPGVKVGQDGFGFAMGPEGHEKVPQLGRVIIEDDVEIGANTCIDRGTGPDTVIGAGTKIDNLVQIAHNVKIGRGAIIVAHVGISGSAEIGDFAVIAGQVGIAGHLKVGKGAIVGAQAGVIRDVPEGETILGSPAIPVKEFWRQVATLEKISKRPKKADEK